MTELFETSALVVKFGGVTLLLAGVAIAFARFVYRAIPASSRSGSYRTFRQELGRSLLLSLELLVAADIIDTVAVTPTLASLQALGLLVLIRTFLSVSLEAELTGRWPWHRPEVQASRSRD